jgi:hypothetical protein
MFLLKAECFLFYSKQILIFSNRKKKKYLISKIFENEKEKRTSNIKLVEESSLFRKKKLN